MSHWIGHGRGLRNIRVAMRGGCLHKSADALGQAECRALDIDVKEAAPEGRTSHTRHDRVRRTHAARISDSTRKKTERSGDKRVPLTTAARETQRVGEGAHGNVDMRVSQRVDTLDNEARHDHEHNTCTS
jgi:hypothetical protein